jgi:DNA repair exonuclease SbcCD ATPase subunit
MKIIINNFKIHKHLELEFPDNKITLIKGISGRGKTTILKAIKWCLFGTIKGIVPWEAEKNIKIYVQLIFDKYTIIRSKNPESVILEIDNHTYQNDVAQEQINLIFGTEPIWTNYSYNQQKKDNILVKGSERDKIELLNTLSFANQNPEETINKISTKIKSTKYELDINNTQCTQKTNEYNEFLTKFNGKFNNESKLEKNNYDLIIVEIEKIKNELVILSEQKILNDKSKNILESLINTKNELLNKKETLKFTLNGPVNLDIMKEKLNTLDTQIKEYKNFLNIYPEYLISRKNIELYKSELINLSIGDDFTNIHTEIKSLNSEIENNDKIIFELKNEVSELERLENIYLKIYQIPQIEDINILNTQLEKAKELQNLHNVNNINLQNRQKLIVEQNNIRLQIKENIDISSIENKIKEYNSFLQYENVYVNNNILKNKIINLQTLLQNIPIVTEIYTENDYIEKKIYLQKYNENLEKCKLLGIEYDNIIINDEINRINHLIEIQPLILKKIKLNNLYAKLSKTNINENDVKEAYNLLFMLEQGIKILSCPSCNESLQLKNDALIKSQITFSPDNTIPQAKSNYEYLKQQYEIKILIDKLSPIPEIKETEIIDVNTYLQKLNILKSIIIIPEMKINLNDIENSIKTQKYKTELQLYQSQYNPLLAELDFNKLKIELNVLNDTYLQHKSFNDQNNLLILKNSEYSKLIEEIKILELPKLEVDIKLLENQINLNKFNQLQLAELNNSIKEKLPYNSILTKKIELEDEINNIYVQNEYLKNKLIQLLQTFNLIISNADKATKLFQLLSVEESKKFDFNKWLINLKIEEKDIENMNIQRNILINDIAQNTENQILLNSYNLQINEIEFKINEITVNSELDINIINNNNKIIEYEKKISEANIYNNFMDLYLKLCEYKNNVANQEHKLTLLYELEKIAKETERNCLEQTVFDLNQKLNIICNDIFDGELNVQIMLYKTLKNENIKFSVNVSVTVSTGKSYDIDEFSTGQQDRVSMALGIALSYYSNSPILLLDESTGYVDEISKEKCFKCIRANTNKTTIVISHVEVEGQYDEVIEIQ